MSAMNDAEAFDFIYDYFHEVFNKRDINALEVYLDEKYRDDDIGPECKDHIRDSKEFLANIFKRNPTIQIEVIKVVTRDNVVSAYLEWSVEANGKKKVIRKGIGIFVVKDKKILKRHTFIYFNE